MIPGPQVRGFVVNAAGESGDALANLYQGASCFLVCGGPSLQQTPLEFLNQRGLLVAAVNQSAATHVRPQLWFSVDAPAHFHEAIWLDPGILKFARIDWATKPTWRLAARKWIPTGLTANRYPNTWFFRHDRDRPLSIDSFLTSRKLYWKGEGDLDGEARETRSVLLVALRMLYWLGVRQVYLVGADFRMTPEATYAFDDPKNQEACDKNNRSYRMLSAWLGELRPLLARHGCQLWNATVGGELEKIPRIDFRAAVERALVHFPRVIDVRGHYRVGDLPKKKPQKSA